MERGRNPLLSSFNCRHIMLILATCINYKHLNQEAALAGIQTGYFCDINQERIR